MNAAQTRFNNDQVRAKQSMLSNLAAKQSLRPKGADTRAVKPNAVTNTVVTSPRNAVSPQIMTPATSQGVSQGGPQGPSGNLDPVTDRLVRQVRLEKLLSAPEVQDAVSRVNLRDYYHGRNSGPDKGRQVLEILNTYLGQS